MHALLDAGSYPDDGGPKGREVGECGELDTGYNINIPNELFLMGYPNVPNGYPNDRYHVFLNE
eukprot:2952486-Pyramimonas_sp.AAC.3